jgi:hypothetical protein
VYQHISCPYLQTVNYQLTKVLEMMLPVWTAVTASYLYSPSKMWVE